MDHELRKAMYIAAAIQGMLAAEAPDTTLPTAFLADRAVDIANAAIGIETGELVYDEGDLIPPEGAEDGPVDSTQVTES